VSALRAALAMVDVVRLMARDAFAGCVLVAIAEVARVARDLRVPVVQRKGGLVVVVAHVAPGDRVVTGGAVVPEPAFMRLFLAVTAEAVSGCLAPRLAGRVAAGARQRRVRALEREVAEIVVELLAAQFHDVGVAAEMLGVAGAAFRGLDGWKSTVETAMLAQVAFDLLVTVETQSGLTAAITAV